MKIFRNLSRSFVCINFIALIFFSASCVQVNESARSRAKTYAETIEQLKCELTGYKNAMNPDFKYSPGVVKKTDASDVEVDKNSGILYVKNEIVAVIKENKNDNDFLRDVKAAHIPCTIVGYVPTFNIVQVRLDEYSDEILGKIRLLDSVLNAERSHVVQAQAITLKSTYAWPVVNYDIQVIWEKARGKGVTIAMLDTGLDTNLSQFEGRIVNPYSVITGTSEFEDTIYLENNDLIHIIDHGTKVAGIACAFDTNNKLASGIAPEAMIMPIQVFGFSVVDEKIITNDLMVIEGIARAIAFKADIINLSLGTDYSRIIPEKGLNSVRGDELNRLFTQLYNVSYRLVSVYDRAFEECEKHGVLVVCSAGNDGIPAQYQPIPSHPYPITAGSLNRQSKVSGFSNYGPKVDCYAPGEDVYAIAPGGNVFSVSGTSFSAPYVSGIIALAKSYGIRSTRYKISEALRLTNIEGRLSILEVKSSNIFYPIGFFNFLGGKIEEKNTQLKAMSRFAQKYGRCFFQKSDSDELKLSKIFLYYSISGKINVKTDPEARFATSLLPKNFDYMLGRASAITDMPNFFAALILAGSSLSQKQLEAACNLLPRSDYMAIILKANKYKPAIPGYYKRLTETPDKFNTNTLYALCEMHEYNAIGTIKSFLEKRQQDPIPKGDEDVACYSLSWLSSYSDEETSKLILKSFERYKAQYENNIQIPYSSWRNMAEALVRIGYTTGFFIALVAIEQLDDSMAKAARLEEQEDDTPGSYSAIDFEYYYKEFQRILNTYTSFGFKFDYTAKVSQKQKLFDSFYKALELCAWNGKIFYLE